MRSSRQQHPTRAPVVGPAAALRAAALAWLIVSGAPPAHAAGNDEIEVEVRTIAFDHESETPVVVLESGAQQKALPIWVGPYEAQAIAREMQGISGPRPLTHDLMKSIVEELDGELDRVVIDDLRGGTYYATIHLRLGAGHVRVDSRPSDAIALALRFERPIFVTSAVLSGDATISLSPEDGSTGVEVVHLWGLTMQDVTGRLAEFFADGEGVGVLVSDVAPGVAASVVSRGDVITEVNGGKVRTVAEVRAAADSLAAGAAVHLVLGRQGVPMQVRFSPGAH
jgi:hypothetical protein